MIMVLSYYGYYCKVMHGILADEYVWEQDAFDRAKLHLIENCGTIESGMVMVNCTISYIVSCTN